MSDTKKSGLSRRDFLAGLTASAAVMSAPRVAFLHAEAPKPAPKNSKVHSVGIYPPVGISRVGNSKDGYFLAPEVPGTVNDAYHLLTDKKGNIRMKDDNGDIKKQVQRFYLFGFDAQGNVVRQFTLEDSDVKNIKWTVHVANAKAAWYGFTNPLNLRGGAPPIPTQRRNDAVTDEDRKKLIIDPGRQWVDKDKRDQPMVGQFWGRFKQSRPVGNHPTVDVKLGELKMDDAGHLMVFPADGISAAITNEQNITNFTDNDGWYDDWCDGWVQAEITMTEGNQSWSASQIDHAWIACCGPNFAPEIPPVVSLYDQAYQVMLLKKLVKPPEKLSFTKDIYPFFHRLGLMDWLTNAANLRQGWADVGNFNDPAYIARLADPSRENGPFRMGIFKQINGPNPTLMETECPFEDQQDDQPQPTRPLMPFLLGGGVNYDNAANHYYMVPPYLYDNLQNWANGYFIDDWEQMKGKGMPNNLEEVPLAEQPTALTRAALEPCSGTGFHPGVELTWYMQMVDTYENKKPYRIKLDTQGKGRDGLLQDFGPQLTAAKVFCGFEGTPPAIGPQMPGDLSRWMGLPWQPDAFSCQYVNTAKDFPTITWWPALLPIDVIPEAFYKILMDTDRPYMERIKFYQNRVPWSRGVAGLGYHAEASYSDGLNNMVQLWGEMGFVVARRGPEPPKEVIAMLEGKSRQEQKEILLNFWIPPVIYVEVERGTMDLIYNTNPNWPPPE
ncbi:MAG: CTQ-dependent glycine oxidase GoxA [Acidobacteriota bacterium]|nr:CTQ-dependent glycine oxidase GoxA [Acidobacteriota bacterium]